MNTGFRELDRLAAAYAMQERNRAFVQAFWNLHVAQWPDHRLFGSRLQYAARRLGIAGA